MEKKTLSERYANEVLTDNSALNHYSQCKGCVFRDKRVIDGEEHGWNKSVCRMYGRITAKHTNETTPGFFSYDPIELNDKPDEVYNNTGECEFYEKEKRKIKHR